MAETERVKVELYWPSLWLFWIVCALGFIGFVLVDIADSLRMLAVK